MVMPVPVLTQPPRFPTAALESLHHVMESIYSRYNRSAPLEAAVRLYGPAEIANAAPGLIYTVPAGLRYQIDLITIVNATAGIVQVDISIGGAPAVGTRVWESLVAANSSVFIEGPIILNAANTLNAVAGALGLSITVQAQRIV